MGFDWLESQRRQPLPPRSTLETEALILHHVVNDQYNLLSNEIIMWKGPFSQSTTSMPFYVEREYFIKVASR